MSLSIALVWGLGKRERGRYGEKRNRSVIWIQRKMSLAIALVLLVCKITVSTEKTQRRRVRAQKGTKRKTPHYPESPPV